MADISPLDPAEYPTEEIFYDVLKRMHDAGLTEEALTAVTRNVGISATPEGYLALGSLIHLILGTHPDKDRLSRLKAPDFANALTAIGVREINARAEDGQHR